MGVTAGQQETIRATRAPYPFSKDLPKSCLILFGIPYQHVAFSPPTQPKYDKERGKPRNLAPFIIKNPTRHLSSSS
ncbi:hypothetical protein I7I53_11781 [Histoplasma capsulatum var. duboisii H88]|uniref:Uncharacterized protein n=1 Tax=Ajellomyces capsulatus (strain H88) TaxID=544711 RepID=A0A8A1LYE2_AJEC8|nr:hypothetical protein I7I53_11781 [Histoplasma capsulatum var. duboisii H88]